ncbi:sensor histidine kinase [Pedobacter antarcticus]|uniref:sensor histidine kinase n=1 Tax=Pedobacter antarcticus TaxID=34086 RepID=UPI00292DE72B|nr:histidine kinase [Pedobacter antarcticus]
MTNKLPLKNLLKLSIYFSIGMSFFLLLSATMEGESFPGALNRVVNVFILLNLMSLGNIGLLLFTEKRKHGNELFYNCFFYTSSLLMSILVILGVYFINTELVDKGYTTAPTTPLRVKGDVVYFYLSLQGMLTNGMLLLLQNFIIVQDANNKAKLENSLLNTARSEAAYQLLLQQIHPHFLFNALNILKSLIKKSPERAEDYLMRLSNFLRVSVSGNKDGIATLKEELKLSMDYLEMQKVRFGTALNFTFDVSDAENSACVLPVFSLQPLLENAIKHNELTVATPLDIEIIQHGNWIVVTNNIQLRSTIDYHTGSGLANLAERYRLISGDDIEIRDNSLFFSVSLKILNDEDCNHRR